MMDAGCIALANALQSISTPSLNSLGLAGNSIGARGVAEMAAALTKRLVLAVHISHRDVDIDGLLQQFI